MPGSAIQKTKVSLKNRHRKSRPGPLPELKRLLARWTKLLPIRLSELSIVFLDDAEMSELHGRLMSQMGPTDILTLDYGHGVAEIFISLDTAQRQAQEHGTSLSAEVKLYLVHGLLHLSGYNDHTPSQIRQMRKAERALLRNQPVGFKV